MTRSAQHESERNAEILRLWRSGVSASDVGAAMRMSRSAVAGVVMRARVRGEDVTRDESARGAAGRKGGRKKSKPKSVAVTDSPRIGRTHFPEGRPLNLRGTSVGPNTVPSGEHREIVLGEPRAIGRGTAMLALRRGDCRFPIGDTRSDDFRFCCAPIEHELYCGPHARLCYVPVRRA